MPTNYGFEFESSFLNAILDTDSNIIGLAFVKTNDTFASQRFPFTILPVTLSSQYHFEYDLDNLYLASPDTTYSNGSEGIFTRDSDYSVEQLRDIEFYDARFDFCLFSTAQLRALLSLSSTVVVSGCLFNYGNMITPYRKGDFGIAPSRIFSLKMEVAGGLQFYAPPKGHEFPQQSISAPTVIIAVPCPTAWIPPMSGTLISGVQNRIIRGLKSSPPRVTKAILCDDLDGLVRMEWSDFVNKLCNEINEVRTSGRLSDLINDSRGIVSVQQGLNRSEEVLAELVSVPSSNSNGRRRKTRKT